MCTPDTSTLPAALTRTQLFGNSLEMIVASVLYLQVARRVAVES